MRRSNAHSAQNTRFATQIEALAKMPDVRSLERGALDVVMVLRYCALCDQARRDPLADLATHFGSVAAASAAIELVELVKRSWPEPYVANRPCCMAMTEHEATLAALAGHAATGSRRDFHDHIRGFVRADRQEPLYDAASRCVAEFSQASSNR